MEKGKREEGEKEEGQRRREKRRRRGRKGGEMETGRKVSKGGVESETATAKTSAVCW